jgi:hypothetical protein
MPLAEPIVLLLLLESPPPLPVHTLYYDAFVLAPTLVFVVPSIPLLVSWAFLSLSALFPFLYFIRFIFANSITVP